MTSRWAVALLLAVFSAQAQDYTNIMSERVATGMQYVDGIVWSRQGFLVFADVLKKVVFRLDPTGPPKPTDEDANGAQGLAYDVQGRLYICEAQTRRVVRSERAGKFDTIADSYQGKKLNSPNDITVRRDGHVYFTDPAFATAIEKRELDFNGIYHLAPRGEIELVAKWATRPNGITLSGDGKTLYVTDADRRALVAFDLDSKGAATNQRDVIKGIVGVPGGVRTDEKGNFYVAAKGLAVYTREAKLLHTFLPGENVANAAFGDADFETLYVTSHKAVYKIRLGVKGAVQY